ncbi:MAG: GvpL/GvpF family gas vesicle protein, partial [Candidatus Eremiobacteraeota bacterium]|nr:GvpL/GvpF family gas vesicle protein [Candidatus Eremiobacteraeota bacterium]
MRRAQAPLAPVDRHLHLLGVADESLCGRRMRVEGERITVTRFEKIALLLRTVEADTWMPQSLELKKNDGPWLEREARLHEAILARAMAQGTVAPARPFTVFTDPPHLEAGAREQYTRWRRTLSRIAGKSEWALHVYRGPHGVPPTRPYLLRTTLARPHEGEQPKVPRLLGEHVVQVWKACSGL